ncbi:hypothetical protein ABIC63_005599 [Pseudacidovorax sp. 1753]|uniref:hypothetical protein n=1 Tax=Pseudacidovorax sp. 1753 TaxID=3156419 RepID=UPI003393EC6D
MSKIIRLDGLTLTDTTAPKIIERDKIESDGSLFLFDPTLAQGAFTALGNGATIPNALSNKAAALLAVPEIDTHGFVSSVALANKFVVERTGRGGVHGIITQSGTQAASGNLNWQILLPAAIRNHIFANRATRKFFFSVWWKTTRPGLQGSSQAVAWATGQTGATSNYLFHTESGIPRPSAGAASHLGSRAAPATTETVAPVGSNRIANVGVNGQVGTGLATATDVNPLAFVGTGGPWGGLNFDKAPSRILYRAYVEDLTASGRAYADVDAIDYALWQAAFGSGGKFNGDTYTDPASLAWVPAPT